MGNDAVRARLPFPRDRRRGFLAYFVSDAIGMRISAIIACLVRDDDLRSVAAHSAFRDLIDQRQLGIVVSVGGGPCHVHPSLTNLNIIVAPNVAIGGSAYQLPFKDGSVSGVHCEAVLEHLEFPERAVAEMFRVLQTSGLVFAATPFLQPYHAYPDHFQNFTLQGHARLFERAGFHIVSAGTCVGPTFAVVDLLANYVREVLPSKLLSRGAERMIRYVGRLFRLADLVLARDSQFAGICSSSFVLAEKPEVARYLSGNDSRPHPLAARPSGLGRRMNRRPALLL